MSQQRNTSGDAKRHWGLESSSLLSYLCVVAVKILSKTDWLRVVLTQLLVFLMSLAADVCLERCGIQQ